MSKEEGAKKKQSEESVETRSRKYVKTKKNTKTKTKKKPLKLADTATREKCNANNTMKEHVFASKIALLRMELELLRPFNRQMVQ